jgi:ribosomal-protein-alanine N-acetyltransferase
VIRDDPKGRTAIRPVTLQDLGTIKEIGRAAFSHWWRRGGFLDEASRDPARLLLLAPDEEGTPVAFIDYRRELDEIHIYNLATLPTHRRRGFAESLLQRVIVEAPSQRVRQISLEVRRSNEPAIRLYERFGFQRIGVRPLYYQKHRAHRRRSGRILNIEDALFMTLVLPRDAKRG